MCRLPHAQAYPQPVRRSRRREFLQQNAALLSSLAVGLASPSLAGAATRSQAGDQQQASNKAASASSLQDDSVLVFDAHLHCPAESGELWQWHPVTHNFEEFVAYLDRTGVQQGIINSQRCQHNGTPAEFQAGNREVARYVEKYKGRFLGSCVVNPLFIDEALREIEDCRKQFGFVWVGELCNYMKPSYSYTIKEFALLVEQVVKHNMILDVHTELEEMEFIIEKFPQATIVFPHFGDDREHAHIFKRIERVAHNSNCYLDTSGYGHDRVGMLEYAVKTIGPDRVLFGSDFSINDPSTVIARIQHSFLTNEQKRKILGGNLVRLLKRVQV
ncbi:MAG: amidohydrolase family protein [Acidobacteriota bacterium]